MLESYGGILGGGAVRVYILMMGQGKWEVGGGSVCDGTVRREAISGEAACGEAICGRAVCGRAVC